MKRFLLNFTNFSYIVNKPQEDSFKGIVNLFSCDSGKLYFT